MNRELNSERAKSSRLAWRIVIVALVLVVLLPPAVIGILMYQAAAQRATIDKIRKLGGEVTVDEAESPDDEASLSENLLALCRIDEVPYVVVAAPYAGDLDELVGAIADLRSAGSLDFRGVNLTDDHLWQLGRLRAATSLDLQATDITDAGLEHLARFERLKRLDLQCTAVSDEAVDALGRAATLETVILHNSRVTEGRCRAVASAPTQCRHLFHPRAEREPLARLARTDETGRPC